MTPVSYCPICIQQGLLAPGENLTFCAHPSRPSLWTRISKRYKHKTDGSSATRNDSIGTHSTCEKQVMTLDMSGVVYIRRVVVPSNSTPNYNQTSSTSSSSTAVAGKYDKNRFSSSVVWRKNVFPLWRRMLKRIKPLPSPMLAYDLTESSLTIWKMKLVHDQQSETLSSKDEWRKNSKPWKVFGGI